MAGWTTADMPRQAGRTAVVTGATGGLGYEVAKALAVAGARVLLTGRNAEKGRIAITRIKGEHASADVTFAALDLASLTSVRQFATDWQGPFDILIENAGIMAVPTRRTTEDGFELQFGTNYLGHFALAGLLLPHLRRGRSPRLVTLASLAHNRGHIDFADPQGERSYQPWKAYGQSKLAMLMLAQEFQRRSAALGWGVTAIASHPGLSNTDIVRNGPTLDGGLGLKERILGQLFPIIGQTAARGALPVLFAATAPEAQAGGYYGPGGPFEFAGAPRPSRLAPHARNVETMAKLWALSVHLTGVDPEAIGKQGTAVP